VEENTLYEHNNFFLAVDGTEAVLMPLCREPDENTTPCTYHNATDRAVYLWHWRGSGVTWKKPCLVRALGVGESIVIYYPDTFIVRATAEANHLSPVIEESNVGDIPRHVVLSGRCFVPAVVRSKEDSLA
jgi:hypothetical protein